MACGASAVRVSALLAAGALGVHELRFMVAYSGQTDDALAQQGHAYLSTLTPLIGALLAVCLAQLVVAFAGERSTSQRRLGRRWWALMFVGVLAMVFVGQELLEGQLAAGHAGGLHGVFGHGGWVAIPLAMVVGPLLALAVREVETALCERRAPLSVGRRLSVPELPCPVSSLDAFGGGRVLARHLAGRAPPLPVG